MLVFQTTSLLASLLPKVGELLVLGVSWAWRKLFPGPADRFAAVVRQVMARDPHILARKYCDRWLLKCALGPGRARGVAGQGCGWAGALACMSGSACKVAGPSPHRPRHLRPAGCTAAASTSGRCTTASSSR